MNILVDLFLTFARIGACTFGGGYAMLPILQRELVENKKWSTETELADYYAVGQCTPGIIAVNTATFVGRSQAGIAGVIATLGVVFPSIVIIILVAAFLQNFMHLEFVVHAFNGVRAGVVALILSSVIKLFKNAVIDWPTRVMYAVVLALAGYGTFFSLPQGALGAVLGFVTSPVFLVIAAGAAGLCVRWAKGGLEEMTLLQLFLEFCKVGLFSVGGGLATIPFLTDLGERTGWFSSGQLADMIAISESTPGPMGVNMATYVGFVTAGVPGGVVATLGLVSSSVVIILIIGGFLERFRQSKAVDAVFYGLRAASVALITAALLQVAKIALMFHEVAGPEMAPGLVVPQYEAFYWPAIILAAVIFVLVKFTPLKKLHPICFIGLAALAGVVLQM